MMRKHRELMEACIVLRCIGLSKAEIAKELGITSGAVSATFHRIKKREGITIISYAKRGRPRKKVVSAVVLVPWLGGIG